MNTVLHINVSVPIWGLFNLTDTTTSFQCEVITNKFPSPSGDYLI